MSIWHDAFKKDPIHTYLAAVDGLLDKPTLLPTMTGDRLAKYERLVKVVKVYKGMLANVDPELFDLNILATPRTAAQQLVSHFTEFGRTGDIGQLDAANARADELIRNAPLLQVHAPTTEPLVQAAADYSKRAQEFIAALETAVTATQEKTKATGDSAAQLTTKLNELRAETDREKGRLQTAIDQCQTAFANQQAERNKQIAATEKQHSDKLEIQRATFNAEITKFLAERKADVGSKLQEQDRLAQTELSAIRLIKAQAAELLQITADIVVTGEYLKMAERERKAANGWRWGAIAAMSLLILAVTGIIVLSMFEPVDWKMILFRYATVIVVALPAVYAMRESSHHRGLENKCRRMQLELSAIDPFISSLDANERKALKKELANRIFGQQEPAAKPEISSEKVYHLLEKLLEGVGRKL